MTPAAMAVCRECGSDPRRPALAQRPKDPANTSGAPYGTVPYEVQGWNWGAFLIPGIWGIGNGVWVGLLGFIPCLNLFVGLWLGVSGNLMAWRARWWPGIDAFLGTQRKWAWAGAVVTVVSTALVVAEHLM